MTRKWVGKPYQGRRYRTRKDAEQNILLGKYPLRVRFRFETAWIIQDGNEVTTVTTPDGRALVGYDDPYMLTHGNQDTEAFVNALSERRMDNLQKDKEQWNRTHPCS